MSEDIPQEATIVDSSRHKLSIKIIEAIVSACYEFSKVELVSDGDAKIWSGEGKSNRDQWFYVHNNAHRIQQIIIALDFWNQSRDRLQATLEHINVLEVGLGYGEVALSVAEHFPTWRVTGLEHPERRYLTTESYLSAMKYAGINLVGTDLTDLAIPVSDSTFDAVLFCEIIEHLPPTQVPGVLHEIARVVKPGGAIIIASPNLVSLFNRLAFLHGRSVFTPAFPLDYAGGTFGHIRLYTVEEIGKIGARAGLRTLKVWFDNSMLINGYETRIHTKLIKWFQLVVTLLMPSLANNWTVLLVKE